MKILSDTDNDTNLKETIPLLSVIKILYNLFTDDFSDVVYKWMKQLCAQQVFQNALVSKSFISLCLTLGNQQSEILTFVREIAFDLHYHLDDIDPDKKVKGTPKYNILTPEVARSVIPNLISTIELILDEAEYILNFMKSNAILPCEFLSSVSSNDSSIRNMEEGVSSRFADLILVFHEMVQTSVPADHTSSSIFKLIARFYRILCALTKYYLLRHTKSKTAELHSSFEKLVKLSHTKLTNSVYSFISYIQVLNEEGDRKKKVKSSVAASKAMREIKTVPTLVFAIESYEKNLILLSKKYNRNLVNHMKLSTARDFRINAAALTAVEEDSQEADSIVDESSLNGEAYQQDATNVSDNEEVADNVSDNEEIGNNESDQEHVAENVSDQEIGASASDNQESDENNDRSAAASKKIKSKAKSTNISLSKSAAISNVLGKRKATSPTERASSKNTTSNRSLSRGKSVSRSLSRSVAADKSLPTNTNTKRSKIDKATKSKPSKNAADENGMDVDCPEEPNENPPGPGTNLNVKRKRLGVRGTSKKAK